jgi:Tfp pilus assembly protein PilN
MMRRIDLMPATYAERRQQRRTVALVVVAGLVILAGLLAWWFVLGAQMSAERERLAEVQARNTELEAQVSELARFAELEQEVQQRQIALQTAMGGDVDWPALLTEVAMVVPGEVWLTNLQASAGTTEGATPVGTETATVDVAAQQPFGRIQFEGTSLSMAGVGKWMVRLGDVDDFQAVWLNSATKSEASEGTPESVSFSSTLELNDDAASLRFQEETS